MRPQRLLPLAAVALSCLAGEALAQYSPYGNYSRPAYSSPAPYYNPYANYQNPYYGYPGYSAPAYGYPAQPYAQPYAPPGNGYYPAAPMPMPSVQPVPLPPAKPAVSTKPADKAKATKAGEVKATPATAKKSKGGLFRWTSSGQPTHDVEVERPRASDLKDDAVISSPLPCENGSCGKGTCSSGTCHSGTCSSGSCTGLHGHGHKWHWYFEATALYVQPRWHDNAAFITESGAASTQNNFGYDWEATPRIEAGFSTPTGLGGRLRYQYLDASATATLPAVTGTVFAAAPLGLSQLAALGDTAVATSQLSLHVFDVEATQRWQGCSWALLVSAGARFAQIEQDYAYTETNVDATTDAVNSALKFNGAGLTAAVEVRRLLGRSGFNLYAIGRGSLLYGTFEQQASQTVADAAFASASRSDDDFLPIGELEAGVGWVKSFCHCSLFVNLGVVGQVYMGAGNSSDSSPTFNGLGVLDPNAQSRRDLSLLGISFTAGLRF